MKLTTKQLSKLIREAVITSLDSTTTDEGEPMPLVAQKPDRNSFGGWTGQDHYRKIAKQNTQAVAAGRKKMGLPQELPEAITDADEARENDKLWDKLLAKSAKLKIPMRELQDALKLVGDQQDAFDKAMSSISKGMLAYEEVMRALSQSPVESVKGIGLRGMNTVEREIGKWDAIQDDLTVAKWGIHDPDSD